MKTFLMTVLLISSISAGAEQLSPCDSFVAKFDTAAEFGDEAALPSDKEIETDLKACEVSINGEDGQPVKEHYKARVKAVRDVFAAARVLCPLHLNQAGQFAKVGCYRNFVSTIAKGARF